MKVAVIGAAGYVGNTVTKFFGRFHDLVKFDPMLGSKNSTRDQVNKCELSVICVPTNQLSTGECDTSIVESVVEWVDTPLILIKSTVEPGTTERLAKKTGKNLVFAPEFVGETKYGDGIFNFGMNLQAQPFYIFGGDRKNTAQLVDIYSEMCGPDRVYRQTDFTTAELVKYMENSYFSTKLIFFYEIDQICKNLGVNFNEVREYVCLDKRVNKWHTTVFRGNKQPFGGKCLPKDTAAIAVASEKRGYRPELLHEVLRSNERIGKLRSGSRVQALEHPCACGELNTN